MIKETTLQALAAITDEGLFERLATAILRDANPTYRPLVHTGVNVAGKTVKSPLDGICFVPNSDPPHLIAVHHTITARDDLEKKWLHDPSKANLAKAQGLLRPPETSSRQRSWWRKSGHVRQICVRRWFSRPTKNRGKL